MANKQYKINRLLKHGYNLDIKSPKHITAIKIDKPNNIYKGSIASIHKEIFGY